MKKRFLSVMLALCMCLSLLPTAAFAKGETHTDHCVCGDGTCSVGDHSHSTLSEWKKLSLDDESSKLCVDGSALTTTYVDAEQCYSLTSGSYYLADSFTLDESIYVPAGNTVTLCLNGKTLTSTVTNTNGSIKVDGNLNLCDCTGTGALTCKGFGVYVNVAETTAGSFAMYGGTISYESGSYKKSGVFLRYNASNNTAYPNFTMYDGTISGFQDSGVQVSDYGIFTMHGGTITGNTRSGNGGGVYVGSNAKFVMKNGTISYNSGSIGAGVYAGGTFTMENGEIKNNTSSNNYSGGGVYVRSGQTFTMKNGSITGNSANSGGGVYISSGMFVMEKGSITGNTAIYDGGGVYNGGDMTISGTAAIKDNVKNNFGNESANNVYLGYDKTIIIGDSLSEGAGIGVTMGYPPSEGNPKDITSSNSADYSSYFFADDSTLYHIQNGDNNVVQLAYGATESAGGDSHSHPMCGAACACGGSHDNLPGWKKLTFAGEKLLADGNAVEDFYEYANYYKLTTGNYYVDQETITLSKGLYIPAGNEVTLCLNGKNLNTGGNRNQISGTLNITDCQTTAGKITGVSSGTESLLNINDSAALNLYQGELSGNETSDKGGAVYISNGGTFSMYGGTIKNNSANGGGGAVFVQSNQSVFNLYGGEISGNKTVGSNGGGAVYMSNGTFNMSGGVISGNSAEYLWDIVGGGVQMNNGTFNMSGTAQIKNNTRNVEGGGTAASNVLLWNSTISVISALTAENAIGITTKPAPSEGSPVTLTGSNNADYSAYFFADNASDYEVANDNGVLKLQVKSTPPPATYTVTYDASGATSGTVPTDGNSYTSGSTVTVLGNTGALAKTGHAFVGWNTWSNGYGTDYAPGATFNINSNTTLYAQWEEYEITSQPVENDPSVGTNADSDIASYQWYKGTMSDVTDATEGVSAYTEDELTSSYSGGWWTCHGTGETTPGYFTIALNAGDSILAQTSATISEGQLGIWAAYEKQDWDWTTPDDHFLVTAPADGNYDLHVSDVTSGGGTQPTVKAQVFHIGSTPADGATGKALVAAEDGWYACKITYKDGTVLYSGPVEYEAPASATYTVTFNANGGSGTMNAATGISGDYTLPACTFTAPAGKQFKAWKIGETEYAAGARITISANTTVTAVWEEITYSVSGTVQDDTSGTAQVTLMKGNTQIGETSVPMSGSPNASGEYSFASVKPGLYNVVAVKDGVTMTILVTVSDGNITNANITMPDGKKNSVLDNSGAGNYAATVGGLDEIANSVLLGSGDSVEIKLTVKAEAVDNADLEHSAIKTVAPGKTLEFIDLSLTKKINSGEETDYGSENTQLLTIVIPFVQGNKQNVTVFRYHGSGVDILTETENNDGEKIVVSSNTIIIYAKKFSTYAIGYTVPAVNPPSSGGGDYTPTYAITVEKAENGEVKANRSYAASGSTVTITVDPETGYVLNKLTVTDERGNNIEVTDKGDGTFTFKMPGRKVTVEASFAAVGSYSTCSGDHTCPIWPYTDAETTAWYHDGVHYIIEKGLMTGYGNGIFKPNTDTSRAMIAVMLWRLEGSPVVNDLLDFEDVEEGQWYTEAIRWAKSEGIAEGYGNGYFGTNDAITREQMVTILWRYAQYKGIDVIVGENTNILSYNDAFDVAEYAIPAMQWACGSGMVQGKNDPNGGMILDPESNGTRAQIATMMMRFCTEIVK